MTRFALIAALLATVSATPALADAGRSVPARGIVRTALDGSTVCLRTAASPNCGVYQQQLLRTVGQKAAASRTSISVNDLGRRQLDALIASIN